MIKLLYITNGVSGAGGLERVLSIKASYLADLMDYEVHILTLNQNNAVLFYDFSPNITFHDVKAIGTPLRYFMQYYRGIRKVVTKITPDVISVCDDGLKGFLLPTLLQKPCPMIYERHVSKIIEMRQDFSILKKMFIKIKWVAMEKMAQSFDRFIVLTNGNKEEWKSLLNMVVIANPLSFYPKESSTTQNKNVIAVGKHSYQKGYDLLLNAWQRVGEKNPDWKLNIYGKIENSERLQRKSKELKIERQVNFRPPEKNIEMKYMGSSIYVMSSRFEGFGMVLIEAMACGLPCVSFDCPHGPADIITDKEDGFLVENGNTAELAKKIMALIENGRLRQGMGAKAKIQAKRYLPEVIVPQWDELFKSLLFANNKNL